MTADPTSFFIGLAAGLIIAWLARGDTISQLREHLHWAREQEAIATDRLVNAWKDGAQVPPRPLEPLPPPAPLSATLQEEINQWEDPETRAAVEVRIRAMVAQGLGQEAILLQLGEPNL